MPCNNHFISKYFLGDGAESCFLQRPLEERRNDTRVKQLFIQAAAFTRFQVVINLNDEGHCGFPWALVNPPTGCLSLAFPPAVTSQSDGRCSPRSSEPAANQGRPSSASPPPPDKKKKDNSKQLWAPSRALWQFGDTIESFLAYERVRNPDCLSRFERQIQVLLLRRHA